jgi:tetratricopeptide (TPR) repeat protein
VFIENDYATALQRAKSARLPLFVDAWAPWCHTCVSMRAFVLKDPALNPVAPKFVWASIDTERESSRQFVERFPMEVWPTLWVIAPQGERPLLKWAGAATAKDLNALLEAMVETIESRDPSAAKAWAAWQAGNEHVAAGQRDAGITEYQKALTLASGTFPVRAQVVEALTYQLSQAGRHSECLDFARREFEALPKGTARLNTVLTGLGCMDRASSETPVPKQNRLLEEANRMALDEREPVLADDRSSLFQELVFQRSSAGDDARVQTTARQWSAFLENEVAKTRSASERAAFDYPRMLAYDALGEPERAIPMLERSERDFPDDYNPPSRLAKVYLDQGHPQRALEAIERAEQRVYGPRKLRVLRQKADILEALKQRDRAREVLQQAVDLGRRLEPLPEGYLHLLDGLTQRVSADSQRAH